MWKQFQMPLLERKFLDFKYNFICKGSINKTINYGSGYGLVLSGNKPSPESMLTKIHDVMLRH